MTAKYQTVPSAWLFDEMSHPVSGYIELYPVAQVVAAPENSERLSPLFMGNKYYNVDSQSVSRQQPVNNLQLC
jgi:hypothetical protein